MPQLAADERAFVRPSPTRGALGGLARHTNEVILLCEAAGYDVCIVESVGLGQSEVLIDDAVDMVLLVVPPAGGDELQGVKRGIVEIADAVIVNKADGDLLPSARHAAAEYTRALQLVRPKHTQWSTPVVMVSAAQGTNVPTLLDTIHAFKDTMTSCGVLQARRHAQAHVWMWDSLHEALRRWAETHPGVRERLRQLEPLLMRGDITPRAAAAQLFSLLMPNASDAELSASPA